MASHIQAYGDIVAGSVPVPPTMEDISSGPSLSVAAHNGTNEHIPFPLVDFHRNQQSFSSSSVCDLNVPFDMNHALDQDFLFPNDFPLLDYRVSDVPRSRFDVPVGHGSESVSSMMHSYHVQNRFSDPESGSDSNTVNFSSASRNRVENVHMTSLPDERRWVRTPNSDIVSGVYDDQASVNPPQIENVGRLDGRFLSLRCQSSPAVGTKFTAYRGNPNNMCEDPNYACGQVAKHFHDDIGGRLAGFQHNFHELRKPLNFSGTLSLAQSNHSNFQAITSTFGAPPVPMSPRGQANMLHLMPAPKRNTSELRKETGSRICSSNPSERQRVPFNSSVLQSNHQTAADQFQKSYVRIDKVMPLPVGIGGGIDKQDKSDQGIATTGKNRISHSSVAREQLKRNLDSPQEDSMHNQRIKINEQPMSHPFSSRLLQNASGQITATSSHDLVSSDSTLNRIALPAMNSPTAFANTSYISVVSPVGPMLTPVPAFAPPTLMPPSISETPAVLPRTVARLPGAARIPAPAKRKLVTASQVLLEHSPSLVAAPLKTSLSCSNSTLKTPSVVTLRKSSYSRTNPAKAYQPYTEQSPQIPAHIKWQASDTSRTPTRGLKCMLCKRDLSYAPDGPVSVSPIPPPVAVLPCGHTFHDHCLLLITPGDQSKDPPCIPCAIRN